MHIFHFAQLEYRHCMKAYKFIAHLRSDVLSWISEGLFPPEELLAHVTALWRLLVTFYPPTGTRTGKN